MGAATETFIGSSIGISRPAKSVARLGSLVTNGQDFVRFPIMHYSSVSYSKPGHSRVAYGSRRCMAVRASSSSDSSGSIESIAPLQLESPIGQFLSQILISHPHLVPAAVEHQLEQLQTDRDAEKQKEEPSDTVYKRIAEVKANERRKALEEILYALVVQKFMDANVSLIPTIAPSGGVDTWPNQDEKLEQLHSPEAYEMIQSHLARILRNRRGDFTAVANIRKLRAGQVYAGSVMYGYFLKRVDQRFQLEKSMKILPNAVDEGETDIHEAVGQDVKAGGRGVSYQAVSSHPEAFSDGNNPGGFVHELKASRMRNYVMSFDGDTLQRYTTIRSKESVSIIDKHTEALFGRPEIIVTPQGTIDFSKDELVEISFGGLKRLVLEAVTFGSFLWDVENYVDSRYLFVLN